MLSDRDQETLRELQRQLVAQDPEFARSFDDLARRDSTFSLHRVHAMPRWVYTAAIAVAIALAVLMLLVVRAPESALAFAILAMMISVVRRRRDEPVRRE